MAGTHIKFAVESSGLIVDLSLPFLAASPDGIVDDKCCGRGVLGCKCPFKYEDCSATAVPYLYRDADYRLCLDKRHMYYCQVQDQMMVCKVKYSDFVVWTSKDTAVVRVYFDESFCQQMCAKLTDVFKCIIMPSLLTDDVFVHKKVLAD